MQAKDYAKAIRPLHHQNPQAGAPEFGCKTSQNSLRNPV